MLWTNRTKQKAGGLVRAKTIADAQYAVEQLGRMQAQAPITLKQTPGGPLIVWSGAVLNFGLFAVSSPIPAASGTYPDNVTPGKGQGTRYYLDPVSKQLKSTQLSPVDIYNWAPASAGGNGAFIVCISIGGVWFVVNDGCSGA